MNNIAIFVPSVKSGGAEKQAALLAQCLSHESNVHFIEYYGNVAPSAANEDILNGGNHLHRYRLKGNHLAKMMELYRICKNKKCTIAFNYLTFCDVYGCLVQKVGGVKKVYSGIRNSRLPHSKLLVERLIHNHFATGTIFNCYSGSVFFQGHGFRVDKCIVIPNCFPEISKPMKRKSRGCVRIITVGRFVEQKDYLTAVRTISILKQKGLSLEFIVVGYGSLESIIRRWIHDYDIDDITQVFINPINTQALLESSDIYLSTSLFEGTSNSIMEALNWSLPVVATNVGDNDYLVKNGKNGFLHPIGDVEGLASSIELLITDQVIRNDMGVWGNLLLQENYSRDLFTKRYKQLICNT